MITTIVVTLLAGLIGLKFPDVDQTLLFPIRHRSAWTHGPIPALVVALLDVRFPAWHLPWMAMLVGLCIHLLADCFVKRWHGLALINFKPINRTLKPMPSFILLALSSWLSGFICWMRF